jgi:NAD(P)-dependent dehydrogenase (short-subunit alcohol dehydrogenase family)
MTDKGIFDLSGKVALVTGGGMGLGRVFCQALAEFGADVACADINREWAEETAALIEKFGHRTFVTVADVSKPDEVQSMIAATVAELGRLDILVNNAGITTKSAKFHEMPIEDWDRLMAVNLRGVFLCMRAALPVMLRQQRGCIINISSLLGLVGLDPEIASYGNYGAAKAGVIALTRQAAADYGRDGIRVNAIAPGWHKGTRISASWRSEWPAEREQRYHQLITERTPLGRRGEADELKGLIVYLASDASSFVTGQVFVQDGGYSAL